jgi:predicted  nucleic acid-binding Zn-ribbon protein
MDVSFDKKQKPTQKGQSFDDLTRSVTDVGGRLRVLEERYMNLRKKTQLTDQTLIDSEKSMMREMQELNDKIMDIKEDIAAVNEKITLMLGELSNCVREHDFKTIAKYVELWEPAQFVTRDEAKELVRQGKSL